VSGTSYDAFTQPTGQYFSYVSYNSLSANYGLTTSTPISIDVEQQQRAQFLMGTATVAASVLTDTEEFLPDTLAAETTATQLEFDFVNNLPLKPAINWPANWGFAGDSAPATLVPGTLVDRFGYPGGTFVSPEGTPFIQRSLAPGTQYAPYNVYQVLQPIDVNAGQIAPAFGMPGNGMQFQLPSSVQSLIDSGHLGVH
jgi:hypothetical protein